MKKSYDKALYQKISTNNLILLGIYSVNHDKCSFERLVKETFALFPKMFSFKAYPQWPDSRKLDRSLRSLRRQGFISGDPQTHFRLTKKGKIAAEDINKAFRQEKLFK